MHTEKQEFGPSRWLVPLIIIAFCITAIVITLSFKEMPAILKRGIQPADFPQLVAGFIILLTLLMLWKDPVHILERVDKATVRTLGLIILFVALTTIDLFLALALFALALAWFWGERRVQNLLIVGLLIPVAVFFLFDLVFRIRFPRGLLTNLWYG